MNELTSLYEKTIFCVIYAVFLTISLAALKKLKTFNSQVLFSTQNNRY